MEEKKQELASLREQWESEKLGMTGIQEIRQQLADSQRQFEQLDTSIKTKQSSGVPVEIEEFKATVAKGIASSGLTVRANRNSSDSITRAKIGRTILAPDTTREWVLSATITQPHNHEWAKMSVSG